MNGIVAREVAKAKRAAKRSAKEEKSEAAPSNEGLDEIRGQLSALTELVTGVATKQQEGERNAQFELDTQGLEIDDTDRRTLKVLKAHDPDLYAAKLEALKSVQAPPAAKGDRPYRGPGQGGDPPTGTPDPDDMTSGTKDDIDDMMKIGVFRENLNRARNKMPGGRGGLFPAKH